MSDHRQLVGPLSLLSRLRNPAIESLKASTQTCDSSQSRRGVRACVPVWAPTGILGQPFPIPVGMRVEGKPEEGE
jgi:hypothetical protein